MSVWGYMYSDIFKRALIWNISVENPTILYKIIEFLIQLSNATKIFNMDILYIYDCIYIAINTAKNINASSTTYFDQLIQLFCSQMIFLLGETTWCKGSGLPTALWAQVSI